jgi:hypothetical protein
MYPSLEQSVNENNTMAFKNEIDINVKNNGNNQ